MEDPLFETFAFPGPQPMTADFLPTSMCDMSYYDLENATYMNLESASTSFLSEWMEQPQPAAFEMMPHQQYDENPSSTPSEEGESSTRNESAVEEIECNIDARQPEDPDHVPVIKDKRVFGWTPEDNQHIHDVLRLVLQNKYASYLGNNTFSTHECDDKVNWRHITEVFNKLYNQNRTREQIYSHFRYNFKDIKTPSYLKGEEQVLLALDEIGVPVELMIPFLMNPRCPELLKKKLDRMKRDGKDVASPDSKEAAFRKRVKDTVVKGQGLKVAEKFKEFELEEEGKGLKALTGGKLYFPSKIMSGVRFLVKTNPHLKKKYNAMKPAGRPTKKTKMVPVTQQLKTLFRPFIYISKRRQRKMSCPGDGRKYGMSLFCLNRLLGSPFELEKMPSDRAEAEELVGESDVAQYSVVRKLMLRQAGKQFDDVPDPHWPAEFGELNVNPEANFQDRSNYYANPDGPPPAVSVLPPTLCTLTGLRGLFCYLETLAATVAEGEDDVMSEEPFGDEESDRKLERFMASMFQKPWDLCAKSEEPADNSDGDSDSDEEPCYIEPVPRRDDPPSEEASPSVALDDELFDLIESMDWNPSISDMKRNLESRLNA